MDLEHKPVAGEAHGPARRRNLRLSSQSAPPLASKIEDMNSPPLPTTSSWGTSLHAAGTVLPSAPSGSATSPHRLELSKVYAEHFAFVWRAARGLGVNPATVDDVVQEVFLVVHRKLDALENPEALRSWLFGITRRVCKDHRRSVLRRGPHVELDQQRDINPERDPQAHAQGRQELRLVEKYVDALTEENRALFFLTLVEGLTIADAAKALNLNPNTTYSRVRVLRQDLQALLNQDQLVTGES
jgi:RNA polymerase sigma-70 factor, ECF subfamily